MKSLLSKILFPLAVVTMTAVHTIGSGTDADRNMGMIGAPLPSIDTVIYPTDGYKFGWTSLDSLLAKGFEGDSLSQADTFSIDVPLADTIAKLTARDTIKVPDSLRLSDPFRYKYYVALLDSATHVFVRDSLIAAGDDQDWPRLDSIYVSDSAARAQYKFALWYASLSKTERKKYDMEKLAERKLEESKRIKAQKDSVKSIKDSIINNTPRILETFAVQDSLLYRRMLVWTHEQAFHKIHISEPDTSFNYRYYDYPFMRKDINATWLGVAGSPVQYYDFSKRESSDKVSFFEAQESWSYTPQTVPMYNVKTPYTELGYFGTLFAVKEKESDNLHLMTTQNISPNFNFTLGFDRFGGGGNLNNETTANKNSYITLNYLGKKYLAHAGYIHDGINRGESGGLIDISGIRDTTLNARELAVYMNDATSKIKKNTLFLDQQYRIPFNFLKKIGKKDEEADTLSTSRDVTTAFIGHSTEYSSYRRIYQDKLTASSLALQDLYNGANYINPNQTNDSLRTSRFENRVFLRLQPWSEDAIVSKLNVGIGNRLLSYYTPDPSLIHKSGNTRWNSTYLYAGAEGNLKQYINWDAKAEYVFLGNEVNDLDIQANLGFSIFPFRKARNSPISFNFSFKQSLDEPEFYTRHLLTNHYKWDNEFGKISTTKATAELTIPRWHLEARLGYSLLSGNIYYDTLGIVRQNNKPMSVLSASLNKEFVLGIMHLDNKLLFQVSSDQDVVPLPSLSLNLRYFVQFSIAKGILLMQIGANGLYNTAWYTPTWNPALGVFQNQNTNKYHGGPIIDAFVNMQWKRATIFVKLENVNQGWPMDKYDYFAADRYIYTQRALKLGIYWPFYTQPGKGGAGEGGSGHHHETGAKP